MTARQGSVRRASGFVLVAISDSCPRKPLAGLPTEVVNDKGMGHTPGTPDAGRLGYIGVQKGVIDRLSPHSKAYRSTELIHLALARIESLQSREPAIKHDRLAESYSYSVT